MFITSKTKLGVAITLVCAVCPTAALTGEPTPTPLDSRDYTPPAVTVTGQQIELDERKNAPVATLIIGEREIERFGDATVGDVLRRLPGMGFSGPSGVVKGIRMRGLGTGYSDRHQGATDPG